MNPAIPPSDEVLAAHRASEQRADDLAAFANRVNDLLDEACEFSPAEQEFVAGMLVGRGRMLLLLARLGDV